jgi:TorA maturation chaperone TorD
MSNKYERCVELCRVSNLIATMATAMNVSLKTQGIVTEREGEVVVTVIMDIFSDQLTKLTAETYERILTDEELEYLIEQGKNPLAQSARAKSLIATQQLSDEFSALFMDHMDLIGKTVVATLGYDSGINW